MAKAKPGQKVRHNATGQTGVVTAVIRGVVYVTLSGGQKASAFAGSFSKLGCMLWIAGLLGLASGISGGVYFGA